MKHVLTASAFLALIACARKDEAPAAPDAAAPMAEEPMDAEPMAADETQMTEDAEMSCPVTDSRDWKAWTAGDGTGTTLHVTGVVDFPTPGYETAWRLGPTDRAMPPGQRLFLDATPPDGIVAQVVTPTEVSYETPGAFPDYRVVMIICGDTTLAEISPVGAGE